MFRLINTFNDIVKMKEKVSGDFTNILDCWDEYISLYPEVKEICLHDANKYRFNSEIKPILVNALSTHFNKLEIAHNHFSEVLEDINDRFQSIFSIKEDILIYFYIGLCNGAGWATTINSHKAILLGVEKIVELNWYDKDSMIALIYHELCHVAHSILRQESLTKSFDSEKCKAIWQLYVEGFAQLYEQKLYGHEIYHQDRDGWLAWCKNNHKEICEEYLHRLKNNLSTQDFFGDWANYRGYSDVGYYLGCQFVKYVSEKYTTIEIAKLDILTIEKLLIDYFEGC